MNRSKTAMATTSIGSNGFVAWRGTGSQNSAGNISSAGSSAIWKVGSRRGSTTTRKARRRPLPKWLSARCVCWAVRGMGRTKPLRSPRRLLEFLIPEILTFPSEVLRALGRRFLYRNPIWLLATPRGLKQGQHGTTAITGGLRQVCSAVSRTHASSTQAPVRGNFSTVVAFLTRRRAEATPEKILRSEPRLRSFQFGLTRHEPL